MPWSFLPAQLLVIWGVKGLRVETGDIAGSQAQKKGDHNSSKGSEDETVYVNHLHLRRCPSLLSPIPVLVLMNLLCTSEDIKGQRGYLLI